MLSAASRTIIWNNGGRHTETQSLFEPASLLLNQCLDPRWEALTQVAHFELSIDLGTAPAETSTEVCWCLFPAPRRQRHLQAIAKPCHGSFVQHGLLQMSRLHTCTCVHRFVQGFPLRASCVHRLAQGFSYSVHPPRMGIILLLRRGEGGGRAEDGHLEL